MNDQIRLTMTTNSILGLLAHERVKQQRVDVELRLDLDLTPAATSCDLASSLDYASLYAETCFILQAGQFNLAESAALALVHHTLHRAAILSPHAGAVAAAAEVRKPEALFGFAVPSVKTFRTMESIKTARDPVPSDERSGQCTTFTCPDATLRLLKIGSKERLTLDGAAADLTLTKGLHVNGKESGRLEGWFWDHDGKPAWHNPTSQPGYLLRVQRPTVPREDSSWPPPGCKRRQPYLHS